MKTIEKSGTGSKEITREECHDSLSDLSASLAQCIADSPYMQGIEAQKCIDNAVLAQYIDETQAAIDHLEGMAEHHTLNQIERANLSRCRMAMVVAVDIRDRMREA